MRSRPHTPARPQSAECLLHGARVAIDAHHTVDASLLIRNETIVAIAPRNEALQFATGSTTVVDLRGQIILPGLINSHDHLQYSNFPRLGLGPYPSWREWAADIHSSESASIDQCLGVPKRERFWLGVIRNLFAGVTTVCHHDPGHWLLHDVDLPINIHTSFGWAHSPDDLLWKDRFHGTPSHWPFILHCAEGIDLASRREIAKLDRAGVLSSRLVLVHAVGALERDWSKLRSNRVWVIWCPSSNIHILNRTLPARLVQDYPFLAIGSDSPISAAGDFIAELQYASHLANLPPDLIYRMATTRPSRLLRLEGHCGSIAPGGRADLFILRDRGHAPCKALLAFQAADLSGVIVAGRISLASEEFQRELPASACARLSPIHRDGRRFHVAVPPSVLEKSALSGIPQHSAAPEAELTKQ